MTRPPPLRPAEERLVADTWARSRTERIRELSAHGGPEPALDPWNAIHDADGAGGGLYLSAVDVERLAAADAIRRVALNLALEAERA